MFPLVWLVTGCSSGLGLVFVEQILAPGDRVIATARRPESIEELRSSGAAVLQLYVASSLETLNETMEEAIAIYGRIDVLVNNAVYIAVGAWEDVSSVYPASFRVWRAREASIYCRSDEGFRANFDTNVFGVLKVTKALLPHFRQTKSGTSVFISSQSGWCGGPFVGHTQEPSLHWKVRQGILYI